MQAWRVTAEGPTLGLHPLRKPSLAAADFHCVLDFCPTWWHPLFIGLLVTGLPVSRFLKLSKSELVYGEEPAIRIQGSRSLLLTCPLLQRSGPG